MPIDWGPMGAKKNMTRSTYESDKARRKNRPRRRVSQLVGLIDSFGFVGTLERISAQLDSSIETDALFEAARLLDHHTASSPSFADRAAELARRWHLLEPTGAVSSKSSDTALSGLIRMGFVQRLADALGPEKPRSAQQVTS